MTRFLRAWAWLRWRTFMNAIERSDRADRLARFSRATEALGPVLAAVMMIPAAVAAMALGLAAGYGMGAGAVWGTPLMHVLRAVLFGVIVLTAIGPLILPSGRGLASLPRLLLLPVSHRSLFAGELLGGLADPWTLLGALAVIMVPAGALAAGNAALALVALAGAVVLIAALVALGAFFGALLHLLMRDRRRGEWIVVLFVTLLPMVFLLPMLLEDRSGTRAERRARDRAFEERMQAVLERPANGALAAFPGELFMAANARAAGMLPGTAAFPLAALAAVSAGATAFGWTIWKRTIERGGVSHGRSKGPRARSGQPSSLPMMRTPFRAIAFSFLHHVLRTARGRTTVLPTVIFTVVLSVFVGARGGGAFGAIPLRDGYAIALFGLVMSFLSAVQLWMNQFAIDRAGLTMLCVQPLSNSQILRGKMAGAAMLVGGLAALPLAAGLALGSDRPAAHWIAMVAAGVATFVLVAPLAAILSIIFPKHVDLKSIGQKSNAHSAAAFLGLLIIFAAAAPGIGAAIFGFKYLQSATAAVGLTVAWLALALLLHWIFWKLALATFERRKESLIAAATGR